MYKVNRMNTKKIKKNNENEAFKFYYYFCVMESSWNAILVIYYEDLKNY